MAMLITPSGIPPEATTPRMIAIDGARWRWRRTRTQKRPSSEWRLHRDILVASARHRCRRAHALHLLHRARLPEPGDSSPALHDCRLRNVAEIALHAVRPRSARRSCPISSSSISASRSRRAARKPRHGRHRIRPRRRPCGALSNSRRWRSMYYLATAGGGVPGAALVATRSTRTIERFAGYGMTALPYRRRHPRVASPPARNDHQAPVFSIDFHGSAAGLAGPFCSSSIEIFSGERTKAMLPSRGGRLMVTPAFMSLSQSA